MTNLLQQFEAVTVREVYIEAQGIDMATAQSLPRIGAVRRGDNFKAARAQASRDVFQQRRFVIHDQDTGHVHNDSTHNTTTNNRTF